jgi:hypothetical protein
MSFLKRVGGQKTNAGLRFVGDKRRSRPLIDYNLPPLFMKVWVRNFCNVVKPTPILGFAFEISGEELTEYRVEFIESQNK